MNVSSILEIFLWATTSLNDLITKIFIGLWKMMEVVAFISC